MTEYVLRLVMVVLPHQRDRGMVLVLEGIGQIVRPSEHFRLALVAHPLKSGSLPCMRLPPMTTSSQSGLPSLPF
jgi:hypothetical protein